MELKTKNHTYKLVDIIKNPRGLSDKDLLLFREVNLNYNVTFYRYEIAKNKYNSSQFEDICSGRATRKKFTNAEREAVAEACHKFKTRREAAEYLIDKLDRTPRNYQKRSRELLQVK